MEIKKIEEKNIWEGFLEKCREKTFLQSWNWGEFQEKQGNKIWRLGIYDAGELLSVCLTALIKARRGTFLLSQHGPNIIQNSKFKIQNENSKLKILEALSDKLKEIGKREGADFVRVAPLLEKNEENIKIFKQLGFRDSPMHASAYESTWKLDIVLPEENLLANMRKTTRYLIRQAIKNTDIETEKSVNLEDLETYEKLNEKSAKRQNFSPFSFEYLKDEFEAFLKDNQVLLFLGKYKKEPAAAALVIFWQGIGFYHQAASEAKYAKFSLPYLILWEAIKEAKKRNCFIFDFWGFADPEKNPYHPWAGPTLFKMGFGGHKKEYVKTQDLILSKRYWLIFIFEKLRKAKRNL